MSQPKLSEESERLISALSGAAGASAGQDVDFEKHNLRARMAYLESRVAELEAENEDQSDEVLAKYHAALVKSGYYNRAQVDNSAKPPRE